MKKDKLVSIIVPIYNVELYLRECLNSILNQSYTNFELIGVNDGSTDASLAILEHYARNDHRIKSFSQDNQGLSGARNTGLAYAKGQYVLFVDSDDIVDTRLVESCVEALENTAADLVIFEHAKFEDGQTATTHFRKELPETKLSALSFLQTTKDLPTSTWYPVCFYAYTRTLLETHGLRFQKGIYHEDILFTPMALSYAKTIAILPKVLYYYRQRIGSITNDTNKLVKSLQDHLYIAQQLLNFSQTLVNQEKKRAILPIVAQRFQFVIEKSKKLSSKLEQDVYKTSIQSLKAQRQLLHYFSEAFYRTHLETSTQRQRRHLIESLLKWPRRIYKYQIKPRLQC